MKKVCPGCEEECGDELHHFHCPDCDVHISFDDEGKIEFFFGARTEPGRVIFRSAEEIKRILKLRMFK